MQESLIFKDSSGTSISAVLSTPETATDRVVIFVHGLPSNKNTKKGKALAPIFNENGISFFVFDVYGQGESGGKLEDLTISKCVDDILQSISLLKAKGYKHISLIGSSFGGVCSLVAAAQSKDIEVLVLTSPVSDYKDHLLHILSGIFEKWEKQGYWEFTDKDNAGSERTYRLNWPFAKDVLIHNGQEAAKNISVPTLIVHGSTDECVCVEQSRKLHAIMKSSELLVIDGADHTYTNPEHFKQMIDAVSSFILSFWGICNKNGG